MAVAAVCAFLAAAVVGGFALGLLARWRWLDDPAAGRGRTPRARRRPHPSHALDVIEGETGGLR